jgi:aspartate racemase
MHKVSAAVAGAVTIPLIDIIDETAKAIGSAGFKHPLLLATRYTMEDGFYHRQMASHGIEVMVPQKHDRDTVHDIIFNELCQGRILETSRQTLLGIIAGMKATGADSIIMGCTEICLLLDPQAAELPGFDSTRIHCQAAADFAF